jgi:hypothetical protein
MTMRFLVLSVPKKMIYRYLASINRPFPDVLGYEVPAFVADVHYINSSTGTNTLYTEREANNTVYSMWIGINDLEVGALLTDDQTPGTNITTFTKCVFQTFDLVYATGARYFVLMDTAVCHQHIPHIGETWANRLKAFTTQPALWNCCCGRPRG